MMQRKDAFTIKRGWVHRLRDTARHAPGERSPGIFASDGVSLVEGVLGGRLVLPVVLGLYSDAPQPFRAGTLQRALFDGRIGRPTVGDYYREVSRGLFDVSGVVQDWIRLEHPESYYVGLFQGTFPGTDRTGEMIREILDGLDPAVDFSLYDNDGPDGVPNSGDDDGYVDALLVIHPTRGAECGYFSHIWSHSWSYSEWPASGGEPYRTGDAAAGGGVILVDDYIIAPALSCEGDRDEVIEIGVYCHEIGHTIGLPDLYDPNDGSHGIGYWGLMGTGNWNTPDSPAHPCGWSKDQLGWVERIDVDWHDRSIDLDPVHEGGTVVRLTLPYTRFTRRRETSLSGDYALVCGYSAAEAEHRNWPGPGYGNTWHESMIRPFSCSGGPVTLAYDAVIDAEDGYDFGYVLIETGTSVETLAVYTGRGTVEGETVILSDYLPPGARGFVLRFLFISDDTESNEDGFYESAFGFGFAIDNVSVWGGGIDYSCDFEEDAGGWRDDAAPAEYFLVENRRKHGFDRHLPGEGLLVWHAENSIAYGLFGNSGGFTDLQARGLVLEEADGLYNLLAGDNMGDVNDPFPGPFGNNTFGGATNPNSRSNGGWVTPVEVSGISGGVRIAASYTGGMPAPAVISVHPDTINRSVDTGAILDIRGTSMRYGASCTLSRGDRVISPTAIDWRGEDRLRASFQLETLLEGAWSLTVVSGDGQAVTADSIVTIRSLYESARVTNGRDYFAVEWDIARTTGIAGVYLFRSEEGGPFVLVAADLAPVEAGLFRYEDYAVRPGIGYAYRAVTLLDGGGEERLDLPGPYRLPDLPFIADGNMPNPFAEKTTISFFVPRSVRLMIDIYDVAGRRVRSWGTERYERGTHRIEWTPDAEKIAAGVYFCVFRSARMERAVKMVLIR